MIKIAIPTQDKQVSGHFGHCPEFTIFDVDGKEVVNKSQVANPGHKPGFLPKFLNEIGVNCILAGGMGQKAVNLFNANNIEVVTGASGAVDEVLNSYLEDALVVEDNICDH